MVSIGGYIHGSGQEQIRSVRRSETRLTCDVSDKCIYEGQLDTFLVNPYCEFQVMQINASSHRQPHRCVSVFRRWLSVVQRGLCEARRFFRKFFRSFSYFAPTKLIVQPLGN
jgi:hypothetical protein